METINLNTNPIHKFNYIQIPNHQFELAFVTKDNQVLTTPSPCKDYLQDIVWANYTEGVCSVWGLTMKPGSFDISGPTVKLLVSGGSVTMADKAEKLVEFINHFEKGQNIPLSKVYLTQSDKQIVLEFSTEWLYCGPMLSAYTTLVRAGGLYAGEEPINYLKSIIGKYNSKDSSIYDYMKVEIVRLTKNLPKLNALLNGKRPNEKWDKNDSSNEVHDWGITNCNTFPTIPVN